jgi:hypothetical protein
MRHDDNMFYCSNNKCEHYSMQPKKEIAQELGEYKLCKDCVEKGYYLGSGVVVRRDFLVRVTKTS